jgi:hypothetical protein
MTCPTRWNTPLLRSVVPMCTPLVSTTTRSVLLQRHSGMSCRTPYSICKQQL